MSSLSLRDPLLRFGLLLLGLVQLSLFIAALCAVGTAPTSVPALIPGNQRCAWVLDEPDRPCVVAINGNPLPPPRPTTSVESLHLNTRSLAVQDALYSSMRGQTTAVLTLGGPQPKERVVALGPNFATQRSVEVALCSAGAFAFALVGWFFLFRTGNKARSRLFVAGSQAGMVVLLSAMVLGSSPVAISPLDLRLYAMLGAGGTLFGALTAAQMALQVCERPAAMARLHALIGVLSVGVMAVEVVTHIGIAFVFAELLLLATGALFLHSALYAPLPADRRDATGFLVGMLAPMGVAGALRLLSLLGLERLLPDPLALIATAIAAPMTMLLSTLREGSFDAEDGLRRLVGGLAVLVLVGLPGLGVGIGVWTVRDTGAEGGAVELALFVILSLFVLPIGAGLAESATRLVFAARQRRRDALSRLALRHPDPGAGRGGGGGAGRRAAALVLRAPRRATDPRRSAGRALSHPALGHAAAAHPGSAGGLALAVVGARERGAGQPRSAAPGAGRQRPGRHHRPARRPGDDPGDERLAGRLEPRPRSPGGPPCARARRGPRRAVHRRKDDQHPHLRLGGGP